MGGPVGEGGRESVRIAWWRTEPAVMAGPINEVITSLRPGPHSRCQA